MSASITKDSIIAALSKVLDPEIKKDLVTLNMIQDVTIENGKDVRFSIVLTTPACPLKNTIKKEAFEAVQAIPGVGKIDINMTSKVRSDGVSREIKIPVRNVIAIGSGKGGVGKSTVAVNLAVALAKAGASVGLMDADIYGPNIPTMMGVEDAPRSKGDKIIPPVAYGVKIISIGFFVPSDQPLIWRGPMLHNAIRQFIADVEWGDLDYLIVDLPPGTGDIQLSLTQSLPLSGGIIVTLPQKVSLEDALRALKMYEKLNVPVLGVIENMSYLQMPDGTRMDVFGTGGGKRLAETNNVPLLGEIPLDPNVRISGDNGKPIIISHPEKASAKALQSIAENIAGQVSMMAYENTKDIGKV